MLNIFNMLNIEHRKRSPVLTYRDLYLADCAIILLPIGDNTIHMYVYTGNHQASQKLVLLVSLLLKELVKIIIKKSFILSPKYKKKYLYIPIFHYLRSS